MRLSRRWSHWRGACLQQLVIRDVLSRTQRVLSKDGDMETEGLLDLSELQWYRSGAHALWGNQAPL